MSFKSAVQLLNEYMPRFSNVQLVPFCWNRHDYSDHPEIILRIMRGDAEIEISSGSRGCVYNFGKAGRSFTFTYRPDAEDDVLKQFFAAASRDIQAALSGKRFEIEPSTPFASLTGEGSRDWFRPHLVVKSLDGDIPGLRLLTGNEGYGVAAGTLWHTYVPPRSPEGKAISAAHSYECLQRVQARDLATEQSQAKAVLEAALKAVA